MYLLIASQHTHIHINTNSTYLRVAMIFDLLDGSSFLELLSENNMIMTTVDVHI